MDDRTHIEAIEASRPRSSDLAEHFPETANAIRGDERLRRLADRVQDVDQRIASLMESVEIPQGLAERLKASLSADESSLPSVGTVNRGNRVSPSRFRRLSSRQWAALSVCLAASAACLVTAVIFALGGSAQNEMNTAIASFESTELARTSGGWREPPAEFRLPPQVVRRAAMRTLQVRTPEYGNVTLVRLSQSATLFVAVGNRRALPDQPLIQQGRQTGVYQFTAWSSGGFTYLLAVKDGKLKDYLVGSDDLISLSLPALGGQLSSIGTTLTDSISLILV